MNRSLNNYRNNDIQTASQEQILVMLYDGTIRFLNLAKAGLEEGDLEKFHNQIVRAQRIILEFMTSLDVEMGGEMAQNLFKLYEYLHYRLIQANLKRDVTMVDEVLGHIRELKQTWEEAIGLSKQQDKQESPEQAARVYSA